MHIHSNRRLGLYPQKRIDRQHREAAPSSGMESTLKATVLPNRAGLGAFNIL